MKFLNHFLSELPTPPETSFIVLDNHSAHRSNVVRDWCASKRLQLLYLPPYSSPLNPIERLWAHFKHLFAKYMSRIQVNCARDSLQSDVVAVMEDLIANHITDRILHSSEKYHLLVRDGQLI